MAKYLLIIAFVILAAIETGFLAAGDSLSHWDQIGWTAMAGTWAILAGVWKGRADG